MNIDRDEQARIEFLDAELDLCRTFLETAVVDAADPDAAASARAKARRGYEVALTWLSAIRDPEEVDRLTAKLDRLRQQMDDVERVPRPNR